jgi:hypothetical protein
MWPTRLQAKTEAEAAAALTSDFVAIQAWLSGGSGGSPVLPPALALKTTDGRRFTINSLRDLDEGVPVLTLRGNTLQACNHPVPSPWPCA